MTTLKTKPVVTTPFWEMVGELAKMAKQIPIERRRMSAVLGHPGYRTLTQSKD
jgi:hypothetical protein